LSYTDLKASGRQAGRQAGQAGRKFHSIKIFKIQFIEGVLGKSEN